MKLIRSTLLVMGGALAASCAVGPRYHRPEAPADAGYAQAPLPESSAAAPEDETQNAHANTPLALTKIPFWCQQSPGRSRPRVWAVGSERLIEDRMGASRIFSQRQQASAALPR